MAVDDRLPIVAPLSVTSTSSCSSSPPNTRRQCFKQVATNNSSTFIQFPTNSRQSSLFVPTYQLRRSRSTVRPVLLTADTQSTINTPSSSLVNADNERNHFQHRFNPILNNPLLNHRKEQPKSLPIKTSIDVSHTTRLCLSSKPSKTISNENQISRNRASTAPFLAHQTESTSSDRQVTPDDDEDNDQQEINCLDKIKYDYITNWLQEVEQATYSKKTFLKAKRSKNRFIQS